MRRGRRVLTAGMLAAVLAAGCTPGGGPGEAPAAEPVDRLLVLGDDGNILTIRPDGQDPVAITSDAAADLVYGQPTWSPTGERVAFAQSRGGDDGPEPALVTTLADGSGRTEALTSSPPFYIDWNPAGDRLVFLANGTNGLDLRLVDVAAGADEAETLASGAPFYLAWATDGDELVTNVGAGPLGRLSRLDLDGNSNPLPSQPGRFQAPQWSWADDRLVYAVAGVATERLVVADTAGEVETTVAEFQGVVAFSLDPAGERIAFTVHGDGSSGPDAELVGVVATAQAPPRAPSNVLLVADLASGDLQEVAGGPVVLLEWAPAGDRLLFATLEVAGGAAALRWQVWDGEQVRRFDPVRPTSTFVQHYLPFYDQYSRSLTLWSPDGEAFTYAGVDADGVAGVWVQPVGADGAARLVVEGEFASWSPR